MARFRDSRLIVVDAPAPEPVEDAIVHDRLLGSILQEMRDLTPEQLDAIAQYQRARRIRFGEAAIALGYVSEQDVLNALSQQFHYFVAGNDGGLLTDELVVATQPFSQQAEAIRTIRSQLLMRVFTGGGLNAALAVVSPDSGDGKTFFSANLAVALAQLGGRTLLLDADVRGPRQHALFGLTNDAGLSSLLSGRARENIIQQVPTLPSLYVLPAGNVPPNPLELLERPAFGLLLQELRSKFDHVVVDTPAAIFGADAAVVAVRCGAALVVARKDRSHLQALRGLVDGLLASKAQLAGVIMNQYRD
jgi:protein-tyrosine kinase